MHLAFFCPALKASKPVIETAAPALMDGPSLDGIRVIADALRVVKLANPGYRPSPVLMAFLEARLDLVGDWLTSWILARAAAMAQDHPSIG